MKVINFFGSSGSGKSTHSLKLAGALKEQGTSVEYVPEYAKYLVYSCHNRMLLDQFKIFSEQRHSIDILRDHDIDYAIVDSPLPLGILYGEKYGTMNKSLSSVIIEEFNTFDNVNFFVTRTVSFNQVGRVESRDESDSDSYLLKELLNKHNINYVDITTHTSTDEILNYIKGN